MLLLLDFSMVHMLDLSDGARAIILAAPRHHHNQLIAGTFHTLFVRTHASHDADPLYPGPNATFPVPSRGTTHASILRAPVVSHIAYVSI